MHKELAERLHAKGCGQQLDVHMETSDQRCSSGACIGTGAG